MALISAILGMLGYAVLSAGSVSLEGAERLAGSQFMQAREQAQRGRAPVRVLIHASPSDADRYRREIVLAQWKQDGWERIGEARQLPRGFYFAAEQSLDGGTRAPETMELDRGETPGINYFYFEYNGRGEFNQPGAQFVIEPGRLVQAGDLSEVVPKSGDPETQRQLRGGFLLLRLGGLLYFPDGDSIR